MSSKPAGVSVTLSLEDEGAHRKLTALLRRLTFPKEPFFKRVGQHMELSTGENFRRETAPDGTPWKKLAPATIKGRVRKKLNPDGILRASGILRQSVSHQAGVDRVIWGARAQHAGKSYARIHQLGGEIQVAERKGKIYRHFNPKTLKTNGRFVKKNRKHLRVEDVTMPARTISIPARPYLGVSAADETEIYEIASEWVLPPESG